jgi:predicted ATPase with chaperone activity
VTAQTAAASAQPFAPPPLRSVEDTGLPESFVSDLILKVLHFGGNASGAELARRVRLPYVEILDSLVAAHRKAQFIEVRGGTSTLAAGYEYALTERGRARALELAERSRYAGPAPVPMAQYRASVKAQTVRTARITRQDLEVAFSDLVLPPRVLDQVGPAIRSGRSVFLFGPPGNGKTSIAERMAWLLGGAVYLPYALEHDGQVIKFFDPLYHVALESEDGRMDERDRRWVLSKRPFVVAGGELTLDALDLTYLEAGRFHEAPLQLKANCGVFLVDDFGRQQISPRALLNRWIVPLEKGVDYINLHSGQTVAVPFDELLVFSTNLEPRDLVDEAFLRRIRYKIGVPDPTPEGYRDIWERVCAMKNLPENPAAIEQVEAFYRDNNIKQRACQPRDLIDQLIDIAVFRGEPPELTEELIDLACSSYFVRLD